MNLAHDRIRLHAYVDGELTPDEVADFERLLAGDPDAMAEVAALRAQNNALHARYDGLLSAPPDRFVARRRRSLIGDASSRGAIGLALAATVVLAAGAGWMVRGRVDQRAAAIVSASTSASTSASAGREAEGRLQSFVQVAATSHAVFVPEVRHPVEVAASDETHLVTWLSKRLDARLVVPHLGDAGWDLLGGRLLPAEAGPIAQFMYQDAHGRRLTLAVSKSVAVEASAKAPTAFRIAEEHGDTVFYWIDADYAYALTGKLTRAEMTALATNVHRQLDR